MVYRPNHYFRRRGIDPDRLERVFRRFAAAEREKPLEFRDERFALVEIFQIAGQTHHVREAVVVAIEGLEKDVVDARPIDFVFRENFHSVAAERSIARHPAGIDPFVVESAGRGLNVDVFFEATDRCLAEKHVQGVLDLLGQQRFF